MYKFVTLIVFLSLVIAKTSAIEIELGVPTTDFKKEKTYHTQTNGLLYVQHDSYSNQIYIEVYIGSSPENLEKVAEVKWFGTITLAIEKNQYWEVRYNKSDCQDLIKGLTIRWTPIIGCSVCNNN